MHDFDALNIRKAAYSLNEAVEITSLCRATLYRAMDAGQLKARKAGKRRVILAADLAEFLSGLREAA